MQRALWLAKKNEICTLIKFISDYYGGDDLDWLKDYCKDIIDQNKDDLDALLRVCLEWKRQTLVRRK